MVIAKISDKFLSWAYRNNYIFRNMEPYALFRGK
jgi:hypothetical protein